MPDNKRQHYVPKYALHHFASDVDRKQIDLINIDCAKVIRGASLRDQCYRDYFYSKKSVIESGLCELEGTFACLTERIASAQQLDACDTGTITIMIALQRARTLRAVAEFNAMMDKMMKVMMYNRLGADELRKVRIEFNNVAHLNVAESIALSPMLLDLEQFLLVNKSSIPFVLSDNPVVFSNWFGRIRFPENGLCGLARAGLQIMLPLSPRFALFLHDGYVYSAKHENGVITIRHDQEIENLNALQWMNAYKNVYISPGLGQASIGRLMRCPRWNDMIRFRRLDPVGVDGLFAMTDKDEYAAPTKGVTRELVQVGVHQLPRDIRLKGLGVRSQPRFFDDGTAGSPLRDPAWCKIVEDFASAVHKEALSFAYFGSFVQRHYRFGEIRPALRRMLK